MYRNSAASRRKFKPPVRTSASESGGPETQTKRDSGDGSKIPVKDDLAKLKAEEAQLDEEIKKLEDKGLKPEQLQEYINLLHEYNEVKDIAQMFLGRLAIYECVTLKEIARRYDAPESD